jgi:hypothetical protein
MNTEKKMKPFDLEAFRAGKKAVTRDGKEARYLGWLNGVQFGIVLAIKGRCGIPYAEVLACVNHEGHGASYNEPTGNDLIGMAPEKQERWANIYLSRIIGGFFAGELHLSAEEAGPELEIERDDRICVARAVKIEWEE